MLSSTTSSSMRSRGLSVPSSRSTLSRGVGFTGLAALEETCGRARDRGLITIADAKRGDIASTAAAYARSILRRTDPSLQTRSR